MSDKIAVYWDFENIHASVATVKYGPNWYRENRYAKQPQLVDIKSIMEFIRSKGDININRAYGNWNSFNSYNFELQDHSIDLIQMFHRGSHGKNGADIRMALDVIEDMSLFQHITTIVIIGGDSDYISLAQKVRQRGNTIVGIGVKETTNQYLVKSCNEFKYYSSLLIKSSTINSIEEEGFEESDIEEAKELLFKSISRIIDQSENGRANKAAIKPMMMRLDPSFDETNFGFDTFNDFLDNCSDIIRVKQGEHDHLISLIKSDYHAGLVSTTLSNKPQSHPYEKILKKQQIRPVDGKLLKLGVNLAFSLFKKKGAFSSYKDFQISLYKELNESGHKVTESEASKIKAILYKSFAFHLNRDDSSIILCSDVESAEALYARVITMLTKRIFDNIDGKPSIDDFAKIILGDSSQKSTAQSYIDKYYQFAGPDV